MARLLPQGITWRSRRLWHPLGYAATAAWMVVVLNLTHEDTNHPLFRLIFIVPLAGWILGILAGKAVGRLWPAAASSEEERRRRP